MEMRHTWLVMFPKEETRKTIFELQLIPSFMFCVFGQKVLHFSISHIAITVTTKEMKVFFV
jgi:hypothetical protein